MVLHCSVLQGVLSSCSGALTAPDSFKTKATELSHNSPFQQALLLCAVELTSYCASGAASFPALTMHLGHSSSALEIWEAVGLFLCYLPAETNIELPDSVSSYLLFMRVKITEQLAWRAGSSVYAAICEGGAGSNAAGDYRLLSSFLQNVTALAKSRTRGIATAVASYLDSLADQTSFADDCDWLISLVLDQHLDLLFGQHLSNIVACCVYSIVRVHHCTMSFKTIFGSMLQMFPHHCLEDFKQTELQQASANSKAVFGSTRQLYNVLFLPTMEKALHDKFPDMHSCQDTVGSQSDAGQCGVKTVAGKHLLKGQRPPLQNLYATDMNTRAGKFRKMQG